MHFKVGSRVRFYQRRQDQAPGTIVKIGFSEFGEPQFMVRWDDLDQLNYFQYEELILIAEPNNILKEIL